MVIHNPLNFDRSVAYSTQRPATFWSIPEQLPTLDTKSTHVWCVPLEMKLEGECNLVTWLSPDEKQRASRYVFPHDRQRFSVCRGTLRQILAAYLGDQPRQIVFRYGPNGKPAVNSKATAPLHFNISYAENLALVAISRCGPLGVDIAAIRPLKTDLWGLAATVFTPTEQAELAALDETAALNAFFCGWTRKEALIKADSIGLAAPLTDLQVGLSDCSPPQRVRGPKKTCPQPFWQLHSLKPAHRFIAALATECECTSIECFLWSDDLAGINANTGQS